MKKIILFVIVSVFFVSCGDKNSENISTLDDVNNNTTPVSVVNYSYIQSSDTVKNKETLIVVIDPHGSGTTALSHFNNVVENYDCTIIGLNNVMNNQTDFIEKITENINTAITNLHLNIKHIFVVGFSGGARMAFMYSKAYSVNGVLMCGAGAKSDEYFNLSYPVALIIGIRDFNFSEHYYSPGTNLSSNINILSLIFDGKHEWSPVDKIDLAMAFLFARNGLTNNVNISDYQSLADSYISDKNYIFAYKTIEAAYKSSTGDAQLQAKQKLDNLVQSVDFKNYILRFEKYLHAEQTAVGDYMKFLEPQNLDWWTTEINTIKNLTASDDAIVANSNNRLLGFLGIVMYSYVKNELKNPQSIFIDKYLKIYELLEPENADLWFFNAVNERNKGNSQLSNEYLQKAYSLGFSDMNTVAEFGM
ncbi:MAG: hypothetical protein JXR68_14045 [Bacteroidales bacterium]|nr:hypothetical protein [Bacteroidales bacterium]